METTKTQNETRTQQAIRLVDGEFTPDETRDVVKSLLDEKINFHKLQRLALWEGDINANASFPIQRIAELEHEKEILKEFLKIAGKEGAMLKITGNLKLELIR